jgi:hypothetical protein
VAAAGELVEGVAGVRDAAGELVGVADGDGFDEGAREDDLRLGPWRRP